MERGAHVRKLALGERVLRALGVEAVNVGEVDEDFLDRVSELKVPALEHRPGVAVQLGCHDGEADAVHERVQKRVSRGLVASQVLADGVDLVGGSRKLHVGAIVRVVSRRDPASRERGRYLRSLVDGRFDRLLRSHLARCRIAGLHDDRRIGGFHVRLLHCHNISLIPDLVG